MLSDVQCQPLKLNGEVVVIELTLRVECLRPMSPMRKGKEEKEEYLAPFTA